MHIRTCPIVLFGVITNLVVIFAIATPLLPTPPHRWRSVARTRVERSTDRGESVLLPSTARASCIPPGLFGAYEVWRPTPGQLAQLESDLDRILAPLDAIARKTLPQSPIPPLISYNRQYIGIRQFGEEPYILVNAFLSLEEHGAPTPWSRGWRRDMVCMEDGGWGYWHLQYDPVGRRFKGFSFNDLV